MGAARSGTNEEVFAWSVQLGLIQPPSLIQTDVCWRINHVKRGGKEKWLTTRGFLNRFLTSHSHPS